MNKEIFRGLPEYLQKLIYVQAYKLISTPFFYTYEREDLVQEFLVYYFSRFGKTPDVDEALVVSSIKAYTGVMYKKRRRDSVFFSSSLDHDLSNEDFFYGAMTVHNNNFDSVLVNEIMSKITDEKVKQAFYLMLQGYSVDQASKKLHMGKQKIYKFFKKMQIL